MSDNNKDQRQKREDRTKEIDISFHGNPPGPTCAGDAIGWAFGVPGAFRPALDIHYTERKKEKESYWVWTRGNPPALAFETGEIFYIPGTVRGMVWAEALKILETAIQIVDATPDTPEGAGVAAGRVTFDYAIYESGEITETLRCDCTQLQFAEVLKSGKKTLIKLYAV